MKVVPGAAAPISGAPMPTQTSIVVIERPRPRLYLALLPTGFHPLSVFSESRPPGSTRGLRGDPGRGEHRVLPLPHVSVQPQIGLTLGGSVSYSYRRRGQGFNGASV